MASSRQIELAASAWLARRDRGDWSVQSQAQLDAWLRESTAHRVAFLRLEAAWRCSDRLKALGAGVPTGVVPGRGAWGLPSPPAPQHTRTAPTQRPRWLVRGIAAGCALAALAALTLGWRHYSAVQQFAYGTAIGVLQNITLPDGSAITLSSDSRILVTLSRGERHIDLQRGEAFFEVAKNPHRPFVVSAGDRRAIAVGTRYDVRRDDAGMRVVVTQGLVRLESDNGPGGRRQPTTLLPAGSVALASDAGVTVSADSVQHAKELLDWRDGFISFHDTPLAEAVAEFNRYNRKRLVIGDAGIGAMRVGGNFRWSNEDSFVRLLELGFPIRAVHTGDTIVLKRR